MNNFEILLKLLKEWVSDCCLMPNEQIFRYIMARTSYIRWEDDAVSLVTCLVASPKQQSVCRHVAPLRHIYIIPSQPIFALTPKCCVLSEAVVNTKFYSVWFDPTGARTHDLPYSIMLTITLQMWSTGIKGATVVVIVW